MTSLSRNCVQDKKWTWSFIVLKAPAATMPNGLLFVQHCIYFLITSRILACASYRLLPKITILQDITGPDAIKFANCFPKGVIEIQNVGGTNKAIVKNARKDTVSRECLRHPEFSEKVALTRVSDHYICTPDFNRFLLFCSQP